NLCLAAHDYHDTFLMLPSDYEGGGSYFWTVDAAGGNKTYSASGVPFYTAILPYVEQTPQQGNVITYPQNPWATSVNRPEGSGGLGFGGPAYSHTNVKAIKIYICPGRRNTSMGNKDDYGLGFSPYRDPTVGQAPGNATWMYRSVMGETPQV